MAEIICCRSCIEPDCRGCNMYILEKALVQGRFERLKDNSNTICIAADVQPVVHGHWIWAEGVHVYGVDSDVQHGSVRCSACGNCSPHSTNYCGYCGADMRGDDDDNV